MRYVIRDGHGNTLASGNQLQCSMEVDLENETMVITSAATRTVIDLVDNDKITITFRREDEHKVLKAVGNAVA